jgi:site-specific DNA-methyltransferase (adenine-specific)
MRRTPTTNTLFYGDNLDILRSYIEDETVDLVYLDPPFNSNATYNLLFKSQAGENSQAQIEAFDDTWHWNLSAERAFDEVVQSGNTDAAKMLIAIRSFLGENDMMAYLAMMAVRLIELHRVLKPTGALYLHCDPTASHYLRILLDAIFGRDRFLNELIWKRSSAHTAKRFAPVHDTIFFYAKGQSYTWNQARQPIPQETIDAWYNNVEEGTGRRYNRADMTAAGIRTGSSGATWRGIDVTAKGRHWAIPGFVKLKATNTPDALEELDALGRLHWPKAAGGMPMLKRYVEESPGIAALDVITDIQPLNNVAKERLGYPTQKPLSLLERLILASSNEGDLVLDPFCGCGTTVHAAQKLARRWIGIDITHLAVGLIKRRLQDTFPMAKFDVLGVPRDADSAAALAEADKHQFQLWALSMVEAQPFKGGRKGADGGVDGYIFFKPDGKTTEKAIVSVKGGGHVSDTMVKDLITTVEHEDARMGVFITLAPPTKPMITRAASAGFYETFDRKYPKVQILTVAELFAGKQLDMPFRGFDAYKLTGLGSQTAKAEQGHLDL